MINIDFFSGVSIPIDLWQDDQYLSSATAFFWQFNNQLFLVSNWHVYSGRNAYTGQPLDKNARIPTHLTMSIHAEPPGEIYGPFSLTLRDGEKYTWLQHQNGQSIDIAMIRIASLPDSRCVAHVPTSNNFKESLYRAVGAECYVVGYPIRSNHANMLPVWKRASVASEYDINYAGMPCFLIDTTTSDGMSGSPVYLRQSGTVMFHNGEAGIVTGSATEFIGVYSGRMQRSTSNSNSEERTLDIGYVWKKSILEEIFQFGIAGAYKLVRRE